MLESGRKLTAVTIVAAKISDRTAWFDLPSLETPTILSYLFAGPTGCDPALDSRADRPQDHVATTWFRPNTRMAAPKTVNDLLALIRRSGVVDSERIEDYCQHHLTEGDYGQEPRRVAGSLVRNGLLSRMQASYLLRGKWRNWILNGKYRILEHLGAGGMGQVFLCEHLRMKRLFAVKILPPDKSADPILLERFAREARAASDLQHANLVRAHDLDTDGSLHYIVLEYVDGATLDAIVARNGPLSVSRACEYVRQAALGLQHAHEHKLVHRDIKPANLLLDRTGTIKIHDLGLARCLDSDQNITQRYGENTLIGTADFLAPEQAMNSHAVDIRADIYGLGASFYFLLTGHCPFPHGTVAQKLLCHQCDVPTSVCEIRPEIPEEIAAIVARMLAKEPSDRFAEPAEVAAALAPWITGPVPPPADDEMPRLSRAVRRLATNPTPVPASSSSILPQVSDAKPPSTAVKIGGWVVAALGRWRSRKFDVTERRESRRPA